MLNLAEKYWDWRNNKPVAFKTDQGHRVEKYGEGWLVKSLLPGHYLDLKAGLSWTKKSHWFKDCIGDRETIERRFGKILDGDSEK